MTDKEIIKALECCLCDNSECLQCQNKELCRIECDELATKTIDLITRQQEEIENLKVENQSLRSAANSLKMHYKEAQAEIKRLKESLNIELENFATEYDNKIKAEAYKEFAKFLIDKASKGLIHVSDLPDFVKEMVGDDNA